MDDELIEEHEGFLRAVAASIVTDEALAQDLVQQTWLAALEARPQTGSGFRGWLATVLRRQAYRSWRSERRRRTREEAVAQAEGMPSAGDLAARGELRQRLGWALALLEEPYRSVLRARFDDDLPPREIAKARDVPVATIKTQLVRGLVRLRRNLEAACADATADERPTDEREEWIVKGSSKKKVARPKGWHLAGSDPADYVAAIDREGVRSGQVSGVLRSKAKGARGFGTLMQTFSATRYLGKRVRLSGHVRTESVAWSALWLRVDGPTPGAPLAFDNMAERPVRETSDWVPCSIVLDVAPDARAIALGFLQSGSGQTWVSGLAFETVGTDVPVTGRPLVPDEPTNLGFDQGEDE